MNSKKITLTTFKKFLRDNKNLYVKNISDFNGMSDMVEYHNEAKFEPLKSGSDISYQNTLGYYGIWLVLSSRDYFTAYNNGEYEGIEVGNCCGSFIVAKKSC